MNRKKELAAYVRNNVEFYEERLSLALGWMERDRCPLSMADSRLYDEICDTIGDWCIDNDIDENDLDFDELIDGDDGIIWED